MTISKTLKSTDFKQLWSLLWLCVRHPLYIVPTLKATRKTVAVCNEEFGKAHHKNGRANAFRHALWNALIVHHCLQWYPKAMRARAWAKKFTDWHEDFSVNQDLARAMDVHNNRVGRIFVAQHLEVSEGQLIQLVMKMIPLSRKRKTTQEMQEFPNQLVHIEDV